MAKKHTQKQKPSGQKQNFKTKPVAKGQKLSKKNRKYKK
jgi:hypothetical protein